MDLTRAGARLQVLLGHLGRPSAPEIVSFGLWMGSQAGKSISILAVAPRAQEGLCAAIPEAPGWRLHPLRTLVPWKGDGWDSLGLGGWCASPQPFERAYHHVLFCFVLFAGCKAGGVKQEVTTSSQRGVPFFSCLLLPETPRTVAPWLACDQGRQRQGSSAVRRGRQSPLSTCPLAVTFPLAVYAPPPGSR